MWKTFLSTFHKTRGFYICMRSARPGAFLSAAFSGVACDYLFSKIMIAEDILTKQERSIRNGKE